MSEMGLYFLFRYRHLLKLSSNFIFRVSLVWFFNFGPLRKLQEWRSVSLIIITIRTTKRSQFVMGNKIECNLCNTLYDLGTSVWEYESWIYFYASTFGTGYMQLTLALFLLTLLVIVVHLCKYSPQSFPAISKNTEFSSSLSCVSDGTLLSDWIALMAMYVWLYNCVPMVTTDHYQFI